MATAHQKIRGTDIGREHALFNQLVRVVAQARHDLLDATVGVTDDARLGRLEIDRAARLACGRKRFVQGLEVTKLRHDVDAALRRTAVGHRQRLPHFVVSQARM